MGTPDLIKESLGLSSIAPLNASSKNQTCPACGKPNLSCWDDSRYKCWTPGCVLGTPGDVIDLYGHLNGLDKGQAYKELAKQVAPATPKRDGGLEGALSYWRSELQRSPEAQAYLAGRGWESPLIRQYEIGYAPRDCDLSLQGIQTSLSPRYYQHRIIFPLRSQAGLLVHLVGRYLGIAPEGVPRVKDSPGDTKSYLFGEHRLGLYDPSVLYITEGAPDALSILSLGLPAVGMLGLTGLLNHRQKFEPFARLVFAFDNDRHDDGKLKSWSVLIPQLIELQYKLPHTRLELWMPPPTAGKDVNDMLRSQGPVALQVSLGQTTDFLGLLLEQRGADLSRHVELLRLCKATGRNPEPLRAYIPADPLEYALAII